MMYYFIYFYCISLVITDDCVYHSIYIKEKGLPVVPLKPHCNAAIIGPMLLPLPLPPATVTTHN